MGPVLLGEMGDLAEATQAVVADCEVHPGPAPSGARIPGPLSPSVRGHLWGWSLGPGPAPGFAER